MAEWFWYFMFYSFLGYLLEKGFAAITRSMRRTRKCFLLLPLCPVYGLAMCAVIATAPLAHGRFGEQVLWGGAVATAVEYLVHWGYETAFGVRFWDYSPTKMDVDGRICLPFSAAWGLLSAWALHSVQGRIAAVCAQITPLATYVMLLTLTLDLFLSARILAQSADTEMLSWRRLREVRAAEKRRHSTDGGAC